MNWRPNVLGSVILMAAVLLAGLLLGYKVVDVLLGASLLSQLAQAIVSLDERNNPRPVILLTMAFMAAVFMVGLAVSDDTNQVALAASLLGNVVQAIIKIEQRDN